jgi:mannose-1-phosphate guanylyltransferase
VHNVRALLLAAGRGARLLPLTKDWPKCLMPIGERPLLEYWLQILWQQNIREVLVNLHHHSDIVKSFLERPRFRQWVKFVEEPELLGTAGTISANKEYFQDYTIMLVHADNWCQCNFGDFIEYHHKRRPIGTVMTMMTFDTDSPKSCGVLECDRNGVVQAFHEKVVTPPGNRANAAVYLFDQEILNWLKDNPAKNDFSTEVLPHFVGRIATWNNNEIHRDIGTLGALLKAQNDVLSEPYWPDEDNWQEHFIFNKIQNHLKSLKFSENHVC